MNRYERTFASLHARSQTAFIPFAIAGDPDMQLSERVFGAYIDAGADILEIGFPFSDPVADGPVNQRAAQRAIEAGFTHEAFFTLIRRLRKRTDIPFGLLTYANSVLHLGYDRFCREAADAGLDSILVADMPPEEAGELLDAIARHGLSSVFIVSELTPPARIKRICRLTTGFIYVVSRLGPTGAQNSAQHSVRQTLANIRPHSRQLPLCVGFGLSTPAHVRDIRLAGADGAIIGSALVAITEKLHRKPSSMISGLAALVSACVREAHRARQSGHAHAS